MRCLQAGARDYLWAQPRHGQGLEAALRDALEPLKRTETQQAHTPLKLPALPGFLSLDQQTLSACETAVRAAAMQRPLLICGASGTGKTLLARKVHQLSARCLAPLVEVYCA
ncbi:sigma 54-interacting transcriptional regulator, partial [Hydrogenophaga sp.]|uniref:sigma 54-interacting transcriptional regulator n=1 Tax=Hydrogenophaga sp. TaxID=1904254 RepID=UPI0016B00AE7